MWDYRWIVDKRFRKMISEGDEVWVPLYDHPLNLYFSNNIINKFVNGKQFIIHEAESKMNFSLWILVVGIAHKTVILTASVESTTRESNSKSIYRTMNRSQASYPLEYYPKIICWPLEEATSALLNSLQIQDNPHHLNITSDEITGTKVFPALFFSL